MLIYPWGQRHYEIPALIALVFLAFLAALNGVYGRVLTTDAVIAGLQ